MAEEKKRRTRGIIIDDKYAIVALPIDYALAKIRTDKDGDKFLEPFAFYGSVEKCLQEYVKQAAHGALEVEMNISLKEASERIAEASRRATQAIREAFPEYEVVSKRR